jgi:competence protein ComEA
MNNQFNKTSKALLTASLAVLLSLSTAPLHAKDTSSTKSVKTTIAQQQSMINLNKSNFEQLVSLKGIGQTKAQAIIVYREQTGGFKSIDELIKVSGIGEKVVNDNRARLSI